MSEHMLDIRLMNDCAYVTRPGSTLQKPIAIKDLVGVLADAAQGVLNYSRAETLRLPENVYLTAYAGNILNLCMYFPQRPVTLGHINQSKEIKYEVMMPNIVVHLALKVSNNGNKHEVTNAWYYATPIERDNLPMVIPGRMPGIFGHMPFPNCYENFTLCYGRNSVFSQVEGGDLRIFKVYYDILAGSPFNNDLTLIGVPDYRGDNKAWFQKMAAVFKAEQRFPYEFVKI